MIIRPPKEMCCSLEPKEIEIINNCILLLKNFQEEMDDHNYSYLSTPNGYECRYDDLTDLIMQLEDLKHTNAMY
jgi:hypothetical protein